MGDDWDDWRDESEPDDVETGSVGSRITGSAELVLVSDSGHVQASVPGGTTVIVGDLWLTLHAGDRKVVRSADLSYRVATEADVKAWQPPG